jgi:hypothetical protein
MANEVSFLGGWLPECAADYPPPSRAESKNACSPHSHTWLYVLVIERRDKNFMFCLYRSYIAEDNYSVYHRARKSRLLDLSWKNSIQITYVPYFRYFLSSDMRLDFISFFVEIFRSKYCVFLVSSCILHVSPNVPFVFMCWVNSINSVNWNWAA